MSKVPFETVEQTARLLAALIDKMLQEECNTDDRRWQFMLHLVQTGSGGLATYVSNCHRDDAVRMVSEWLERQRTEASDDIDIDESCWTCGVTKVIGSRFTGRHRRVFICGPCMNSQEAVAL